jgi:Spy/CpxP family protein refolding chaperone
MLRWTLLLLLLALPAAAQLPRGFYAWWDTPVVRDLNLSEDQMRQIRSTVREYRIKLVDLRASLEKAEIEVEDAFNDDNFDSRRASEGIDRLASARGDLTRVFSQMSLRLRALLTADQWRELQKRRPRVLNRPPQPGPQPPPAPPRN